MELSYRYYEQGYWKKVIALITLGFHLLKHILANHLLGQRPVSILCYVLYLAINMAKKNSSKRCVEKSIAYY
jgi:hypothetical protein